MVLALGTLLMSSAGAALAQSGGGGLEVPDPPVIDDVTCVARCLDIRTVAETGKIEITGSGLGSVATVKLKGTGRKLKVKPAGATDTALTATVPIGATDGKPRVIDAAGQKAASPVAIEVKPEGSIQEVDGFSIERAEATPRKSFFDSARGSELAYLFEANGPTDVRVDVVSKDSGETVDSVVEQDQEPFANHRFKWNGLDSDNGVARNGRYRFKVSPLSGGAGAGAKFSYYDHIFPLRGKHTYGDGLGAGRGHMGQDVFAKCGTKIVAARGGRIQANAYQSAAGYYLVIDGNKTGKDYTYMHMEQRGRPAVGTKVHTGDVIGYESDTGDAQGCHLHFELWSAPGWYEGGHVLDPTAPLKKWDKYS